MKLAVACPLIKGRSISFIPGFVQRFVQFFLFLALITLAKQRIHQSTRSNRDEDD